MTIGNDDMAAEDQTGKNGSAEPEEADDLTGDGGAESASSKRRQARTFPAMSFKEAMAWPAEILQHGAGKPIRRLTLLDTIQRSPTSSATRALITASNQYALTSGGYNAENVELTRKGRQAVDPTAAPRGQATARFELSIEGVAPFKALFDTYAGSRLPAVGVLRDAARDAGTAEEHVSECVETFLVNVRDLGLVATIAGTEHLLRLADLLERISSENAPPTLELAASGIDVSEAKDGEVVPRRTLPAPLPSAGDEDFDRICFIVSPIGETGSEARKHADLVLNHLIIPALDELGLRAVRADNISKPGMITSQVMEHLVRSKLVIADLSFANPNVYYELAVRHAARRPAVQLTRSSDRLPFDVGQFRTVVMDMTDIYTLVPQLDLHRAEIARQSRAAVEGTSGSESPISRFYPSFWDETFTSDEG